MGGNSIQMINNIPYNGLLYVLPYLCFVGYFNDSGLSDKLKLIVL